MKHGTRCWRDEALFVYLTGSCLAGLAVFECERLVFDSPLRHNICLSNGTHYITATTFTSKSHDLSHNLKTFYLFSQRMATFALHSSTSTPNSSEDRFSPYRVTEPISTTSAMTFTTSATSTTTTQLPVANRMNSKRF